MYIQFHRSKTKERKFLARQKDLSKTKFDKMLYSDIFVLYSSVCCFTGDLISFLKFFNIYYTLHDRFAIHNFDLAFK